MALQRLPWPVIEPAATLISPLTLATKQGFAINHRHLITGVDISGWIDRVHEEVNGPDGVHLLQKMFFWLCDYLKAPLTLVFIFNGPQSTGLMDGHIKELVKAFGFYHHQAPGSAVAELAMMNSLNIIDAVLTEDSDTLVFGATCVIRNSTVREMHQCCEVYFSDVIENSDNVHLPHNAPPLYYHPTTSWTLPSPLFPPPIANMWRAKAPLIPSITYFGTNMLGWSNPAKLVTVLHENVWPGVVLSTFCSPLLRYAPESHTLGKLATPYTNFKILASNRGRAFPESPDLPVRCITVTTDNFVSLTCIPRAVPAAGSMKLSVPACIYDMAMSAAGFQPPSLRTRNHSTPVLVDLTLDSVDTAAIDLTLDSDSD